MSRCGRGRTRAALIVAVMLCAAWPAPAARGQPVPAGSTGAVLSFIDAAAGRIEVVRHWPATPIDVDVYPFVPYFWDGCIGPGAILMLVTGPAAPVPPARPPLPAGARTLGVLLADTLRPQAGTGSSELAELHRLAASLRTPGDPLRAAVAALAAPIADLASYERHGYAVFAFITWQGWRCAVTLRAVPEGYGIPFVR